MFTAKNFLQEEPDSLLIYVRSSPRFFELPDKSDKLDFNKFFFIIKMITLTRDSLFKKAFSLRMRKVLNHLQWFISFIAFSDKLFIRFWIIIVSGLYSVGKIWYWASLCDI